MSAADAGCPGEALAKEMEGQIFFPKLADDPNAIVANLGSNGGSATKSLNKSAGAKPAKSSAKSKAAKVPTGFKKDEEGFYKNKKGERMIRDDEEESGWRRMKPSELYAARKAAEMKKREEIRPMIAAMMKGEPGAPAGFAPDRTFDTNDAKDEGGEGGIAPAMPKINIPAGDMRIKMPNEALRANTRKMILEQFRSKYKKLKRSDVSIATDSYTEAEASMLQIKDGHKPMPRPEKGSVQLPKDFRKPIPKNSTKEAIGSMTLSKLLEYGVETWKPGQRMLVSVYGDIFDVSDRPDKYGPDGPYHWMTGHDLTWGFVSGSDHPDKVDKFYDYWKVAPESLRDRKLQGILAWVAWYEWEYGKPVGILEPYVCENGLKGPPIEDAQECCVM
jgi:hypothetical protein